MKWEYNTEVVFSVYDIDGSLEFEKRYKDIINTLNNLGKEGWELVTVSEEIAYFKRQTDPDPGITAEEFDAKVLEVIRKAMK